MLSNDILSKIDDETDIVSLVSEFVSLEKRGKNYLGLCPFHDEKTPSFSVSPEKNIAKCMGCGEGGRPLNFYRKIKNVSLSEAAYELGKRIGLTLEQEVKTSNQQAHLYELMKEASNFYQFNLLNSVSGQKVVSYLSNRNLSEDVIKEFEFGFSSHANDQLFNFLKSKQYNVSDMIDLGLVKQNDDGKYYDLFINRLMIPIKDENNRVIGFSARALEKKEKIKYINSPETPIFKKGEVLYNLDKALIHARRQKELILLEGFFDVIASSIANKKNGVATMGTALTASQAKLISRHVKRVVIAYDGDNAGINASIKAIPILLNAGLEVWIVRFPDSMDPDEYITKYGEAAYHKLLEENRSDPYAFQYNHYREKIDFNNANDIKTFQKNVTKMLEHASQSIVSIYQEKLAKDLNIEVNQVKVQTSKIKEDFEYKIRDRLINKYELSEHQLIMLMIQSKKYYELLINELEIDEYSTLLIGSIRNKVVDIYDEYDLFDMLEFKKSLTNDELKYFDDKIKNNKYLNSEKITENEVKIYVKLIKETKTERRRAQLTSRIAEKMNKKENYNDDFQELRALKNKMINNKEDLNGN